MNKTSPKQWTETPAEAIVRLNQPMERKPRSNRVRKAIGAGLLAATVAAVGVPALDVLGDKAVQSVEADTHRPTEAQKQAMQRGLDAQTTTTEQTDTPPTSIHKVRPGETAWGIVEDAQAQGLVDNNEDIRPKVDAVQAQAEQGVLQAGQHVSVPLDHPQPTR